MMPTPGHRRRKNSVRGSFSSPSDVTPSHIPTSNLSTQSIPTLTSSSTASASASSIPTPVAEEQVRLGESAYDTGGDESSDTGSVSGEDLHDDEEAGLTRREQRRKRQKQHRNMRLDQRVARDQQAAVSKEEKQEADQSVLQHLAINTSLILLWYLFSLSISLYNKWMFDKDHFNFPFPLFITSSHMFVQFVLASLVLYFIPSLRPSPPKSHHGGRSNSEQPIMSKLFYLTRIGPCGLATGLDIGLGNMSLQFITLTFYTMCKSSALAFVLFFAFVFRLEQPTWRLVAIIATMILGVIMMVAGEMEFSLIGFLLVLSAAFFSGFRWALTQILLVRNPATSNPFASIFFLAPVMFISLFFIAIPIEGPGNLYAGLHDLVAEWGFITFGFLLFPGCIAFLMTASEFALLQRTSVVTLSIAGIFKEVITILAAAIIFEDQLTLVNFVGLITTMIAIITYNYMKITRMREDAVQTVHRNHVLHGGHHPHQPCGASYVDISRTRNTMGSEESEMEEFDADGDGENVGLLRNQASPWPLC